MARMSRGRRSSASTSRDYPRTARVNELIREVVAEELEAMVDEDERLELVTVTGVDTEPDFRHAKIYFSGRHEGAGAALEEHRVKLQAAIGRQARLKRTPLLTFVEDHGIATGWRIEGILKTLDTTEDEGSGEPEPEAREQPEDETGS